MRPGKIGKVGGDTREKWEGEHGMIIEWCDVSWHGILWHGMVWYGMAWHGIV